MDLLWPDAGRKVASNSLRTTLHAARKVLDPAMGSRYLASEDESLVLCPGGDLWVDVDAFEEAAATARGAKEPSTYRAAFDLYEGDLLPENRYEEWAEGRRRELRQLYLALILELARLHEDRGEHEPAIEALRKVAEEEPSLEEAHAGLMRLYAVSDRPDRSIAQYERLRELYSSRLGTQPSATTRRLRDEIAAGAFPQTRPSSEGHTPQEKDALVGTSKHNLPAQRTSFVGRERELAEVKMALAMTRLMTLTGTGGSGKTHLALEVAKGLLGAYPDGVWMVDLGPLADLELVAQEVAGAIGVTERPGEPLVDTLVDVLGDMEMLLVLDNCEHLIEAAARLADEFLRSCPRLKVLATSREPLGIAGEVLWQVNPLSLPDTDGPASVKSMMRCEAPRLFVDRARLRLPDFELTEENVGAVARVCLKLDGIPLAIELATARMGTLAVGQVAQRLEVSLDVLKGVSRSAAPRHRTLRATLDWSHDLLSEAERPLFRRLSVLAGGWTLEAAEAVCSGDGIEAEDVLDVLGALVDKSLVVAAAASSGALRYRMLEPVRQYARERLERSEEVHEVLRQHATFFLVFAEEAEPQLKGAHQEAWLERLEREHDNLRAALSWILEQDEVELPLRFGAALGEFWHMRGHLSEGRRWLEATLAKGNAPSYARVKALAKAGWIAWEQGDLYRSAVFSEEGLALARRLGDETGAAATLINLGIAMMLQGELGRAVESFDESLPLLRRLGDETGLSLALLGLGDVAMLQGNHERATTLMQESLAAARSSGDMYKTLLATNHLGLVALLQGEYENAERLCRENLKVSRGSGMGHLIALSLHIIAASAGAQGHHVRSARLWGAAAALREAVGTTFAPEEYERYKPYITSTRDRMSEESWEAAWAQGRAMTSEQAAEYALSEVEPSPPRVSGAYERPPAGKSPQDLTRREREVADLVARGLTNRQIASDLSVSEHTVASHVAKILRKLGVDSRVQIVAWITEQQRAPVPHPD